MNDTWSTAFQALAHPAPPARFDWPEARRRIVRHSEVPPVIAAHTPPVVSTPTKIAAFIASRAEGADVIQVARAVGIACPTALRHLRRMRDAGLIDGGAFRGDSWRPLTS